MLIIVEGPDCVGKSTYVANLRRELDCAGLTTLRQGPPRAHPLDEYELPLVDYSAFTNRHIICDRWHLGELVYPAVLGRATQLTAGVFRHIELLLASRRALVVVVDASVDELARCLESRGDDLVDASHVDAIRAGYHDAERRTQLPVLSLNSVDVDDRDAAWAAIDEARVVDYEQHGAVPLDRFVTYVGPATPKLLLLGDVRATVNGPDDRRPAFMPYPATSGAYLLDVVGDALPNALGVANACDVDDPRELWLALGRPETVALGINAQRRCPWADRAAPHPQYWRRFRHHDRTEYRALLLGEQSLSTYSRVEVIGGADVARPA